MEEIKTFAFMYWQIILMVLSLMCTCIAVKIWWDEVRYFFMRVSWGFPFLGKISRAGRKSHKLGKDGWYPTETELCADFARRHKTFNESPDYYERCDDYLNKAEEIGRSEKGFFLWSLIVGLILLEAVGFAYVLAPFMTKNASSNEQSMLAWFIAFLLSIAAVCLTEQTGKQWHKNELISKIREWWANDQRSEKPNLQPEKNINLDKTYGDNDSPKYIQLLNRVSVNAKVTQSYKITVVTFIYIMALAVAAYLIRSYNYDADSTENVNQGIVMEADQGSADPMALMEQASKQKNSTELELPGEMAAVNQSADQQAKTEAKHAITIASKVTFIILSIIYVMIQVVGIYFGYAFSLVGKEARKAHRYTKDFNNASELNDWLEMKKSIVESEADSYLQRLQERLSHRDVTSAAEREALESGLVKRNFATYLMRKNDSINEASKKTQAQEPAAQAIAPVAPVQVEQIKPAVIQANTTTAETTEVKSSVSKSEAVAKPIDTQPVTAGAQALPAELSELDLCNLDDNDLNTLADDFNIDLNWLQRQQRVMRLKRKATAGAPA